MEPLLSVVTITYNHEPYIAKCIEGVLMQKVDFPIEFIIAEDCSTDGTRSICEDYAAKHPDIIRLITSEHNVGINPNERRAMAAARGKYVAYCEGDDYWTDPLKLQKQVDFLESHPDYSVCFHNRLIERKSGIEFKNEFSSFLVDGEDGFELTFQLFFHNWVTFPFSMVFLRTAFDLGWYEEYTYFRDSHMIFHFLQAGRGFIFSFVGGVRTVHEDSMFYSMSGLQNSRIDMLVFKELYIKNKLSDESALLKREYVTRLQVYLENASEYGKAKECLSSTVSLFTITFSMRQLLKNIRKVIISFKNGK